METNNFHYVAVLLDLLYKIEISDENLEEIGLIAWELIGNKNTRMYRYRTKINSSDNSVTLPCNASSIESITSSCEDYNRVTNYSNNGDYGSLFIENSIESDKVFNSPYYSPGKLLNFRLSGNTIYFSNNYGTVNILYKGIVADEEGLPMISNKEALAIATYIAYVEKYKEALRTNNAQIINFANLLEQKWLKQCDLARVTSLSQNTMNQILDIKGSWNRKSYGLSYKPIP